MIVEREGKLGIFTHGIGVNKFIAIQSQSAWPTWRDLVARPISYIAARGNDKNGPYAFKQLDTQAYLYWENNYA